MQTVKISDGQTYLAKASESLAKVSESLDKASENLDIAAFRRRFR